LTYPFRFVSLWDMLEVKGSEFLNAYQMVCTLVQSCQEAKDRGLPILLVESSITEYIESIDLLERHCAELELPLSTKSARKLKECFESSEAIPKGRKFSLMQVHDLYRAIDEFTRRIRDEYTTRVFLAVPYGRAKYYADPKAFFGNQAWDALPTRGQFEMEEACRSFALARSTAAVFHVMRLLEVAIGAVRSSLGLPAPIKPSERNWGVILKSIKDEIGSRNAKGGKGWAKPLDRSFFDEVYLLLSAVRDTWRNPTMHVENKYTEEEAENILGTARAFVRKVAARMDENGDPKA
jgi:hypothetical protein